jgi:hypothetical protein
MIDGRVSIRDAAAAPFWIKGNAPVRQVTGFPNAAQIYERC